MKHVLQSLEWSFGRRIKARFTWQRAHGEGGMVVVLKEVEHGAGMAKDWWVRVIFRGGASHALDYRIGLGTLQ